MRYDYDGKNVIVTGATGGIGKEVAKGIIAGGGSVALIGLTLDEANKVASATKDLSAVGSAIAKAATEPGPPISQSENPAKNPTHG